MSDIGLCFRSPQSLKGFNVSNLTLKVTDNFFKNIFQSISDYFDRILKLKMLFYKPWLSALPHFL